MNKVFLICIFILIISVTTLATYKKNNIKIKQSYENYIVDYNEIDNLFQGPLPSNFESSFDWATNNNQYKRKCTTPVRNQGVCGCCWACTMTTLLESAYYRQNLSTSVTSDPKVLSTQQIIDCLSANPDTASKPSSGCDGGYPIESLEAYLGTMGKNICTEEQYPFVSNTQIGTEQNSFLDWVVQTFGRKPIYNYPGCQQETYCKDNAIWFPQIEVITFKTEKLTVNSLKKAIYWLGPIYIGCQVPFRFIIQGAIFKNYIYSAELDKGGDHAMVITGWGTSGKGKNYWIIQNSWGNSWGNNGFVWITQDIDYIKRNADELAAIKIQRNCIDLSPNPSIDKPSATIEILHAYQRSFGKSDNANNLTVLEFLITAYIPVDHYIENIYFVIPGLNEKRAANYGGLVDSDGNIRGYEDSRLIFNVDTNYYYNQYGIVAEPKSLDWGKRWFVYRRRIAWHDEFFEREWSLVIKINDRIQKVYELSVNIDWNPLIMPLPPPGSIVNADITYSV